jgi:O-acetyl-ADP-ribose deacetylase (regulator of RNase III)
MITYKKGNIFKTARSAAKDKTIIIPHICNNKGGWGRGFVLSISNEWEKPEQSYRKWYNSRTNFKLGFIQLVNVEDRIYVCNMIAQDGYKSEQNPRPISYEALSKSLQKLVNNNWIQQNKNNITIMMPRIGCGLGGGKWEEIEKIISNIMLDFEIEVYDL